MEPLYEFHEKFVNPKMRRLREHHFKDVCAVDNAWLRLCLIQAAYGVKREKIRDTWIDYFGPTHIAQIMRQSKAAERELAGQVLMTFHRRYAALAAYEHFPAGQQAICLGRLGIAVGRALLGKEGLEFTTPDLEDTAWNFEQELRQQMPDYVLENREADGPAPNTGRPPRWRRGPKRRSCPQC